MPDMIAEQQVIWVLPDGERRPGRIAIGAPWVVPGGHHGEARCAYFLEGLEDAGEPLSGDGTLEALILAVRLVGHRLHVFTARGGHVTRQDDFYQDRFRDLFGPLITDEPHPSEFVRP